MAGFPWLRFLEAWMVQQLLRTPAFHRAVEKVAKGVHRARHGLPPEEMGGVSIDQPQQSGFMRHFSEEIKTQLGTAERREASAAGVPASGVRTSGSTVKRQVASADDAQNADAAWQSAQQASSEVPRQGFMGEYMHALREQVRGGQPSRK